MKYLINNNVRQNNREKQAREEEETKLKYLQSGINEIKKYGITYSTQGIPIPLIMVSFLYIYLYTENVYHTQKSREGGISVRPPRAPVERGRQKART